MEGRLIAFVIWVIIGVLFIVMGIYDFNSKKAKPFGFWANAEVAPIEDVKGYNRALGILWCVYGILFTLIGLPLLDGLNSGLIIIPILGAMLISIAAMVAYVVRHDVQTAAGVAVVAESMWVIYLKRKL